MLFSLGVRGCLLTRLSVLRVQFVLATTCSSHSWPYPAHRRAKIRNIGYGIPSDFELNFGKHLPALGQADDEDTDTQAG